jgi:hypothetical protein
LEFAGVKPAYGKRNENRSNRATPIQLIAPFKTSCKETAISRI